MAEETTVVNTAEPTTAEATDLSVTETDTTVTETVTPPAEKEPEGRANERIRELNERVKNAEEQNRIALQTIQQMQQNAQRPPVNEPETEYLDPAVSKLSAEIKRQGAATAGLWNELDLLKVKGNPNYKDYPKYESAVEQIVTQARNNGQFFTREQVYIGLKGQEALKGGNRQPVVEKEPETPAAIPQTKATVKISHQPKGAETLEQKVARLKNVTF
jgi:hypothetical protein